MEPIVVIVGFLGAGKTTLMKRLVRSFSEQRWHPYVVLNDYENADVDAQQFQELLQEQQVAALSGSCICCSGLPELRQMVNAIPQRAKGITFIEANGTTDACELLGFLAVGLASHFMPPVQVAVVDVRHWQQRGVHNELEANQIQMSSLVVLNHTESVSSQRCREVEEDVRRHNSEATILAWQDLAEDLVSRLDSSGNTAKKMDHAHTHWSSCSVDLPDPIAASRVRRILDNLPESILRVKACSKLDEDSHYSYIEMIPSGEVFIRPYTGRLVSGPKLLTIGPGSDPTKLRDLITSV